MFIEQDSFQVISHLYKTIVAGDTTALDLLLRDPAQRRRALAWGSCMHLAAAEGPVPVLEFLLQRGFSVGEPHLAGCIESPLCAAAGTGNLPAVRWLLRMGADIHAGNPLIAAVTSRSNVVVAELLAAGADPAQRSGRPPRNAVEQATRLGLTDLVPLLNAQVCRATGSINRSPV